MVDHHSPAILAGSVSVAAYPTGSGTRRINVFAIGTDGHLYELWWHSRTWSWNDQGGPGDLVGSPSSVTYVDRDQLRRLHIFALGADGHLHEFSWNGDDWAWADEGRPGSELIGSPAVVAYHDADGQPHLDVVAIDRRGRLHGHGTKPGAI